MLSLVGSLSWCTAGRLQHTGCPLQPPTNSASIPFCPEQGEEVAAVAALTSPDASLAVEGASPSDCKAAGLARAVH